MKITWGEVKAIIDAECDDEAVIGFIDVNYLPERSEYYTDRIFVGRAEGSVRVSNMILLGATTPENKEP